MKTCEKLSTFANISERQISESCINHTKLRTMESDEKQPRFLQTMRALIRCRRSREFARVLAQELSHYFQFDVTGLDLYSPASGTFTSILNTSMSRIHLDETESAYEIIQIPAAGTMKDATRRAQAALKCDDLINSDWVEGRILRKQYQAASNVIAPLIRQAKKDDGEACETIGVMFIATASRNSFSEQDRLLLEQLGILIGPILDTVLIAEGRDALMAINQRVIVGEITIQNMVPTIKEILQQVIPHDGISLIKISKGPQGKMFELLYSDGLPLDLATLPADSFGQIVSEKNLKTSRPVLITGHAYTPLPEAAYFESIGILSDIVCPLVVNGQAYGFLIIASRRRNAFSEHDLELTEHVGHHLSRAIGNILAYEEVRVLKEQLERENVYLREEVESSSNIKTLLGKSAVLQKTFKAIERVAPTDSTVLILGETGTGKELVAQALHQLSPRRERTLIKVNCAALPATLIESELFGHEKGAFTSATARKIGRFELADQGTLFLDEVGEIPLELQSKLLRALEDQHFERVGGSQSIRVNVRILAATNVDLEQAVNAGTFRADLYYRLKVFPITIPPLRERREDIPLLARHFVKKYATQHRKPITRISSNTLRSMSTYNWPGNVRELNHMIERAVILAQDPVLTIEELEVRPTNALDSDQSSGSSNALEALERAHILEVLHQTNWVVAGPYGAATKLGIHRATLQYRMKKLGIQKPHNPTK